jgi:nucleotide-binding universal stress UspA family protein
MGRALGLRPVLVYVAESRDGATGSARGVAAADLERALRGLPIPPDAVRRIEFGDPAELVVAAAADERAALILSGTRGAGGRANAVFGSVAARIIELSPVPVVIAPPRCCDSALAGDPPAGHEIVIAVDGSPESRAVTGFTAGFAQRARASVVLAHVLPPLAPVAAPPVGIVPPLTDADRDHGWRVLDQARRLLPDPGAAVLELRQGIPARELDELARERGADLIAVGTSRPGRLRRALAGSLSDELAASSQRLVMVVPHDVARSTLAFEPRLEQSA